MVKSMKILEMAFCIFPITSGTVDQQKITTWSLQDFMIFVRKILGGFGENSKKPRGSQIDRVPTMMMMNIGIIIITSKFKNIRCL